MIVNDENGIPVLAFDSEIHRFAGRRILNRVRKEVYENLPKQSLVAVRQGVKLFGGETNRANAICRGSDFIEHDFAKATQFKRRRFAGHLAGLSFAEHEDLLDQAG